MRADDEHLVGRCLQGDTDAYGLLVERYQGAVYATAHYYVGRYGSAEDVAQEALMEAYRSLPKLRDATRFGPWLKEVTCRTAANWLRRHGRRINSETPLPFRKRATIEDFREGPATRTERAETYERVQLAIDSLPERYRWPVMLRFLQELSYEEISAFTGDPVDEVRGLLQRAGRQLRELLADMNGESEGETTWHRVRK